MQFVDVAVVVSDAKASAKWWKDKVGFEVRDADGHWVTVAPKGTDVVLHLCEQPKENLESGNTGIGFAVADASATAARLAANGVSFAVPLTKQPWGSFLRFLDPDGNEFWITEDPDLKKPAAKTAKRAPSRKVAAKKGTARKAKPAKRKR